GRLASQVAMLLRGKHKPIFAPHMDTGDFVVVVNAEKVALSGTKLQDKRVYRHSGYPGGIHSRSYAELLAKHPERVVETAVKGMPPRHPLGRQMLRKLKVHAGPAHPHQAQQPTPFTIKQVAQQAGPPAGGRGRGPPPRAAWPSPDAVTRGNEEARGKDEGEATARQKPAEGAGAPAEGET